MSALQCDWGGVVETEIAGDQEQGSLAKPATKVPSIDHRSCAHSLNSYERSYIHLYSSPSAGILL